MSSSPLKVNESPRMLRLVKSEGKLQDKTQKWLFALLFYNTCVAPMSAYCANSLIEYGMDVAKYNVIAHVVKFLMKEVNVFGIWSLRTMPLLSRRWSSVIEVRLSSRCVVQTVNMCMSLMRKFKCFSIVPCFAGTFWTNFRIERVSQLDCVVIFVCSLRDYFFNSIRFFFVLSCFWGAALVKISGVCKNVWNVYLFLLVIYFWNFIIM